VATGPRRYHVEISRAAAKQFEALPRREQERIMPALLALADDPRPHGVVKIKGVDDQYRIRVGEYRVLYAIADDRLIVLVLRIGHRRDVYRKKKNQ
jgi:mRNA interferase RelE/StbE